MRLNCREFMSVVLQELQKALGTFNYTNIGLAERESVVEGSHYEESIEFISWLAKYKCLLTKLICNGRGWFEQLMK